MGISKSICSALLVGVCLPTIAQAQDAQDGAVASPREASGNVIMVTARKRSETDLEVPIAIRALGAEQLDRQGIQSLADVAATTPSLNVSPATGNSGGTITLRGIGTPPAGPGTDQAVSINLDGMTITDGLAVRMGQFDLQRIEILQGPQSLFFGKNSSGGIVSLVSADPTDFPYAMLRVGYGFEARQLLTEAVVAGPITDKVGARLAFYRSDMDGYFKNPLAYNYEDGMPTPDQIALFGPLPRAASKRAPAETNTGIRGTLTFNPTDRLSMKIKGTWSKQDGSDSFATAQQYICPEGVPTVTNFGNVAGIGDCELNEWTNPVGRNVTEVEGGDPQFGDGTPFADVRQVLVTGSVDYEVADGIMLSSVTGYYDLKLRTGEVVTASPYPQLGSAVRNARQDFTQELRVTTDLDSPLNAMFGLYYQDSTFDADVSAVVGLGNIPSPIYNIDARAYSIFGQLIYDLTDQIEISAGGRYTDEKKDLTVFSRLDDAFITGLFPRSNVSSKRFSPEVTLSYRPNGDTNTFITYKKGSKSGAFNLSALLFPPYETQDISFNDELVEGFEGGVKTVMMGGQLRVDLTGYRYTYTDFQVTVFDPVLAVTGTRNAAKVRNYGVQLNTSYSPDDVPGLNLGFGVNYGKARYKDYLASCFTGQSQAEGCIFAQDQSGDIVGPTERGGFQDLSGKALSYAPDWTGNFNVNYELPISSGGTMAGMSFGATYQSAYESTFNQVPGSRQDASVNLDATLRLFEEDGRWELALIGKNLTNQLRAKYSFEQPFTPGVADPGTGSVDGPLYRSDVFGITNAPRTFMLRLTFKPWGSE